MKRIGLFLLLGAALTLGTGCILEPSGPEDIAVTYEIIDVRYNTNSIDIDYKVTNVGDYDLDGIQLKFGLDINLDGDYTDETQWTFPFNLDTNQTTAVRTINIYYANVPGTTEAAVIGVGMDNPPDE